jgi:peptidoglycan hydrolase-like protein with peptidoglycan-binding domain
MDTWVQKSQQWLNSTYKSRAGYLLAPEDGLTGWDTMYALTTALQLELGITATSKTFGPTTISTFISKVGSIDSTTANRNLIGLAQCALWCKGYWGDTIFGTWTNAVSTSVASLRSDMGVAVTTDISVKIMKSLLTMDAYVTLSGGRTEITSIQRWLNGRYLGRSDFFVIPCDGLYSRGVQQGMLYAAQYEIGLADGVANGTFGPKTQDGLRAQANYGQGGVDSAKAFIRLFQASLIFNGFSAPFDGNFGPSTATAAQGFQKYCALTVSGRSDFSTWASLLSSTGDTSRQGVLADSITTITADRAATLKSLGYKAVGRYLTNYPGDPSKEQITNKRLQPGEISVILNAGLRLVPIYQSGSDAKEYFKYPQGSDAGYTAHTAASAYGLPEGTTIYFAVDYDAVESEVVNFVVPYFNGVVAALTAAGGRYKAGIYSARNTCRLVSALVSPGGSVLKSFVSDMSTGYSGNLGFTLPQNWAWDQILEYGVGSGTGAINIDKSVSSGSDAGVSTVTTYPLFMEYLSWLVDTATSYGNFRSGETANILVTEYLRANEYTDAKGFAATLGPINTDFVTYVDSYQRPRLLGFLPAVDGIYVHADHWAAALEGVMRWGLPTDNSRSSYADINGWAGDVVTIAHDFLVESATYVGSAYTFGRASIGSNRSFSKSDWSEDIDGVNIGSSIGRYGTARLDVATSAYYGAGGGSGSRVSRFYQTRFGSSSSAAKAAMTDIFTTPDPVIAAVRNVVYSNANGAYGTATRAPSAGEIDQVSSAWADTVISRL